MVGEEGEEEEKFKVNVVEFRVKVMLRDEFFINMQKFVFGINRIIQQIEGEVRLEILEVEFGDLKLEEILVDNDLMIVIKDFCFEWVK